MTRFGNLNTSVSGNNTLTGTLALTGDVTSVGLAINGSGQLAGNGGASGGDTPGVYNLNTTTTGNFFTESGKLYAITNGKTTGTFTPTGGSTAAICGSYIDAATNTCLSGQTTVINLQGN
ncbi:MAG: hypothetical protein ORN49_00340 [Rhodobacteraceae bacterium]|nr:hypothetical protein [Paracoccaceae bacterium]